MSVYWPEKGSQFAEFSGIVVYMLHNRNPVNQLMVTMELSLDLYNLSNLIAEDLIP